MGFLFCVLSASGHAAAQEQFARASDGAHDTAVEPANPQINENDPRSNIPILAYTYGATGSAAKTMGIQAYGLGLTAAGQSSTLGGGATLWWSPLQRLTLVGDGQRN